MVVSKVGILPPPVVHSPIHVHRLPQATIRFVELRNIAPYVLNPVVILREEFDVPSFRLLIEFFGLFVFV